LKLKIAERKSKRDILRSYGSKQGKPNSAEGAIVTQTSIETLTKEIKTLRKSIKKDIQIKNE